MIANAKNKRSDWLTKSRDSAVRAHVRAKTGVLFIDATETGTKFRRTSLHLVLLGRLQYSQPTVFYQSVQQKIALKQDIAIEVGSGNEDK